MMSCDLRVSILYSGKHSKESRSELCCVKMQIKAVHRSNSASLFSLSLYQDEFQLLFYVIQSDHLVKK